jgi:hypothetical protein
MWEDPPSVYFTQGLAAKLALFAAQLSAESNAKAET